jgi:hypothetical protein
MKYFRIPFRTVLQIFNTQLRANKTLKITLRFSIFANNNTQKWMHYNRESENFLFPFTTDAFPFFSASISF